FFIRRAAVLFDQVDHQLEEAAQLLGARPFFGFWHITLPLCRRPLIAEAIMIFLQSIGLFGAVILFAGNIPGRTRTLTLAIFDAFESNPETAFSLAAL
ncbi:MAG: ABC transporter permease subunit, partial [Desulfuromonadales bacterium]|nr:ABC transporter permease subunit [Desulfuromonadales bacterium]NIS40563.1 ABC transporter permease subunit [Desulfuromonadales bacterium]